jgi:hypothetical protein
MPGLVVIHGNLGERGTRKTLNVSTPSSLELSNRKDQLQERRGNMDMCVRPKRNQNEQGRNELTQLNNP